jgi:NTE family protein
MTIFDSITYKLNEVNGKNILVIKTTPSWNNHGDILFGLSLSDDFKGHSTYNLKLGYLMYGVNSLGAQWRNDAEIGDRQKFYTELYQPLDYYQSFYIKPFALYESATYIVPTDNLGNQELESSRYGGGFSFGSNLNRNFKVEFGGVMYSDKSEIAIFDYNERFTSKQLKLSFLYDSLDNYNFPNSGFLGVLKLKKDSKEWGSDYDYEQIYIDVEKPLSYKDSTFVFKCKYGHTDVKSMRLGQITVYDKFYLGGIFDLSGYQPYSFVANDLLFGYIKYRYRLKEAGFFGSLGTPLYAGATFEGGNTWSHREKFESKNNIYAGSVFLAADTPFGALHLAYGYSDKKHEGLYFYLGEKF